DIAQHNRSERQGYLQSCLFLHHPIGLQQWRDFLSLKRVSAGLFDFFEVFGYQRVKLALIRILAVDRAAVMNLAGLRHRILDQKRTLEQDLATCAAACAFTLATAKEQFIFLLVNVGAEKPANLARRLPRAKLESR